MGGHVKGEWEYYLGESNGDQQEDNETQARDQTLDTSAMLVIGTEGSSEDQGQRGDTIANDTDNNLGQLLDSTSTTVPDGSNRAGQSTVGNDTGNQPPHDGTVEKREDQDVALLAKDDGGDEETGADEEGEDVVEGLLVVVVEAEATVVGLGGVLGHVVVVVVHVDLSVVLSVVHLFC